MIGMYFAARFIVSPTPFATHLHVRPADEGDH